MRLWNTEEKQLQEVNLVDYIFNFQLSEARYCIGYKLADGYHPCPTQQQLEKLSYDQCNYCQSKFDFKGAFFFDKPASVGVQAYLDQKHVVYLAYFLGDIIKVGTTSFKRKNIRTLEQDSLVSMIIAEVPNAQIAKALEEFISKTIGITQFVRSRSKIKNVYQKPSLQVASQNLKAVLQKIIHRISNRTDLKDYMLNADTAVIMDFSNHPLLYFPQETIYYLRDNSILSGTFKGIRGKYLFIENNKQILYFKIPYLIGRYVESTFSTAYNYNIVSDQFTLFS